ncbi:hypothetical protein [Thermomonospora cellulosilytica]|uniref:Uncharacterized protein n=1 Tax=Thermomonospora cellulosilytica TaxID=1411118 RepID=A0A7W3R6V8_9ACTN|nr:hypothetical protein [Thermomonospora cellulosilytica]MBA9001997.1 hypothetical protein [Thermomonospora cellulosilytica]
MSGYRVHAAPAGVTCDAGSHGGEPVSAAVVTADGSAWCRGCWREILAAMTQDGQRVTYTTAARTALGLDTPHAEGTGA